MPPPRPRGFGNSSGISGGRPSPSTPMSERQQMALLMQMTSSASPCSPDVSQPININHLASRSRDRNERGETSLHVAAIKGDIESVKKLIESGVSPNVLDFAGWSPLHEACSHGYYNIALALVKAGANVNAKGLDDDTPLHDAAVIGNLKLVKLLIEKGADIFAKNRKGKTPADVAASSISSYMCSLRDANQMNNKSSQSSKRAALADQKRSSEEREESTTTVNCDGNEEGNVYVFKKYSKDCLSINADEEKNETRNKVDKPLTNVHSDDLYTEDDSGINSKVTSLSVQTKRSHSDAEIDEITEGDDIKRKKRKDSENIKESSKGGLGNKLPTRHDKVLKQTVVFPKTTTSGMKSSSERRSPCVSPKLMIQKGFDNDQDNDDSKVTDNSSVGGPKVPPLKIVIPQQNCANDLDCGSRNGKTNSTRSHPALPYVVSSSNSNDSISAEKDASTSRCNSPTDVIHKNNTGSNTVCLLEEKNSKLSHEEKGQQRILRSSHRSCGPNIDRSSNNSSPQLQSNSPSPATVIDTNEKTMTIISNVGTVSPQSVVNTAETETGGNVPSPSASSTSSIKELQSNSVELHPRKRKIRAKQEDNFIKAASTTIASEAQNSLSDIHPHDHPFTNCYQMYLNLRKQIEKKHRCLYPIQPRPPQGFSDYLVNRRSYLLANKNTPEFHVAVPLGLAPQMIDLFKSQEGDRFKLKIRHIVEKEKLGLTVEQEILRVHGKAARSLACQSVPFSVCSLIKDEEVYNLITPEQEEKDRNARYRYNGRLFLGWLQDVDDKWEKIKEAMVLRHHNEAESLHAIQKMDWEEVLKEHDLCDEKTKFLIQEDHVPIVHVSDDFDLLPA